MFVPIKKHLSPLLKKNDMLRVSSFAVLLSPSVSYAHEQKLPAINDLCCVACNHTSKGIYSYYKKMLGMPFVV